MISIVIPTYNSEKSIEKLCETIVNDVKIKFEIILINDASTDKTEDIINNLKLKYNFIRVLNLNYNIGQVGSTLVGIDLADGDFIVTMDDDLQHHPKFINNLYAEIKKLDVDVIVAKWKQDETIIRNLSSYIFSVFSSILILKKLNFRNTAYRIIKKEIKSDFVDFFISRFWIDPRRLRVKVSQINVFHNQQTFRPYSSFKFRLLLALKHFLLDSYLIQILIFILGSSRILTSAFFAILFYALQNFLKERVKAKRLHQMKK